MILPKSDVFVTLSNDGPSMDEREKHWSMIMHGDSSQLMHVKCIHELYTLLLDIPTYLQLIRCYVHVL
jgi:hypothetical protein